MITIYAPNAQDFSTLGLGALAPYECVIEEQAGGMYELSMTHPMDGGGKWLNIGVGCVLKAPAPVRETPLAGEDEEGGIPAEPVTVTRRIYRVRTNTGANLHLRQGPSTSTKILSKYRPGTEVVVLSQSGGWGKVIVRASGASGYMYMQYLVYVREETETVEGDVPSPERVVYPVQSRMQLFRVVSVERDAAEREVRVTARHIFYDLLGNVVKNEYAPEGVAANTVVGQLFERALNPHDFDVHCQSTKAVTGEYTRRGMVECLLDPDDGVVAQAGARLIRDNFDIWILPDAARETGVTIRHGKNLLGATLTTDMDSVVTRIIPVGQDSEGKPLLLSGTIYVDSPHIGDYPTICAQAIEYDVKVGQDGINNAAQARTKLTELAQADFSDNGVDLPTVGLDVDFVALGETEEYRQYADLQAVHLYDTVRVIAKSAGIDAAVRVTGYKWDALGRKYESVTLGEIADLKTTVYGYQLSNQSIKTVKIANGAIGSAQLRELAVQYAHIGTAAVEQLSANSITALKAYITEIVAGNITTDELYAAIASIALAQITTANIEKANIDWAQIGTLAADVAEIAKAHLGDADIDWANIQNLTAAVAEIADAKIENATIGTAQIEGLNALVAQILHAEVEVGDFTLAEVQNLLANALILEQGSAGSMSITNLVVTQANMLGAVIQNLVLPGTDGKYYEIVVGADGALSTSEVTVSEGEIAAGELDDGRQIVATTINAGSINGSTITAQQAILDTIFTQALTAGKITAGDALLASATIPTLYATSIQAIGNSLTFEANEKIQSIVGDVGSAQGAAEAAQEAADFAAPYISATPPETALEAGKLWLDEGVTPPVLRAWRGLNVTTAREYVQEISGDADSPAFVSLDNGAGQLQSVAVEAGCRAKQAGTGAASPANVRTITGRESVAVEACGKNIADVVSPYQVASQPSDAIVSTIAPGSVEMSCDTATSSTWQAWRMWWPVKPGTNYTISAKMESGDDSFPPSLAVYAKTGISGTAWYKSGLAANGSVTVNTNDNDFIGLYLHFTTDTGNPGARTVRYYDIQIEEGSTATAYEPYRSMGGGTVTPTEPLYGLPGAEDTVEASVDGDVTVTRRTAALELDGTENWILGIKNDDGYYWRLNIADIYQITTSVLPNIICSHYQTETPDAQWGGTDSCISQNYNANARTEVLIYDTNYAESDLSAWKAYLAAQAAAGTPVTIVYELAAPETEALTAISPIVPQPGQLNLFTDADALTATIHGSGWETVNDTSSIQDALANLDGDLASLINEVGLLNGEVGSIAQQIISPDGIKNIVFESSEYQAMANTVDVNANELSVTQTTVTDINGRVETIEGTVRISGSNIDIGRSDSNVQLHLDNTGWSISESGQETIYARQNRVVAPRFQTTSLIFGALAFNSSGGHFRLMKYGG